MRSMYGDLEKFMKSMNTFRLNALLLIFLSLVFGVSDTFSATMSENSAILPELVRTTQRQFAIPFRLPKPATPDAAAQQVEMSVSTDLVLPGHQQVRRHHQTHPSLLKQIPMVNIGSVFAPLIKKIELEVVKDLTHEFLLMPRLPGFLGEFGRDQMVRSSAVMLQRMTQLIWIR